MFCLLNFTYVILNVFVDYIKSKLLTDMQVTMVIRNENENEISVPSSNSSLVFRERHKSNS